MASYYVWSGATGSANGSSWANAYTQLATAFAGHAAGDTYYVAHDHVQAQGSAMSLDGRGDWNATTKVICVDRAGSVPPVTADKRTTAAIGTTGFNSLTFSGSDAHYDGIIFSAGGSSSNNCHIIFNQGTGRALRFDNCSLRLLTTDGSSDLRVGGDSANVSAPYCEWQNTTVSFGAVGQQIFVAGTLRWRNTPSAIIGTAVPTNLFTPRTDRGTMIECIGIDFSALGSGKTLCQGNAQSQGSIFKLVDCKIDNAVTIMGSQPSYGAIEADAVRSSATGNVAVYRRRMPGLMTQETTIVRSGGATDGTTPMSWKLVTGTLITPSFPFECPPIAIWCDTTGSAKTATVECTGSAVATDKEMWLDVEYLGDATSPQGSFVNDSSDLLTTAANQTTSAASWSGGTTPFKLAATFTPQQKGWVYARVKCAKVSATYYIDPLVTLT